MGMRLRWRSVMIYTSIFLCIIIIFGWRQMLDENLVDLHTCPACYGQSHCSSMFEKETFNRNIRLTSYSQVKYMNYINIKNVYYAKFGEEHVVLKKLAHDSELREIDEKFCKASKLPHNCNVSQAIKIIVTRAGNDIFQVIRNNKVLFEESDAVKCSHDRNILKLYEAFARTDSGPYHIHHFLTMLAVNMEPLLIMTHYQKWFPRIIGTCGRMLIEEYVGPTLTQLGATSWIRRADYARQLLEMARELSDGEFHLYMTDVSLDNFAVDSSGKVKMIDAEDLIIVDSAVNDLDASEHVNDGFGCRDCLSYSIEDLCSHRYSDHNYFAVCKGMLSSSSFSEDIPEGLLHSPPDWVAADYPSLLPLVEECASHPEDVHNYSKPRRKESAVKLHSLLSKILRT
ncbi:divergent protein kinase domain 2A-like [Macrobrachium nipponense]|uniref:divergent protein kinase domain 2A-like n=1 Tax=Macrobrachium nipponense TaxID=159736 RepID=UPI0030C80E95